MKMLFELWQKVACIDSKGAKELIEGKTYIVQGYEYCEACKDCGVFVGIKSSNAGYPICSCGAKAQRNAQISFRQTRFIPIDTEQALDEEIHQALKEDLKIKNFQDN